MTKPSLLHQTCLLASLVFATPSGADPRSAPSKDRSPHAAAARGVTVAAPADAPSPPADADKLKKTQPGEMSKLPEKKEIKAVEDPIYSMEKPTATIWAWKEDPAGNSGRDVAYVEREMAKLVAAFTALKEKSPAWPRLGEYEKRIAHLQKAQAAQQRHYGAVTQAKSDAVDAAAAAAEAAFMAKRVTDDGQPNDFHKKMAGKFAFAAASIGAGDAAGSGAVTSVEAAAPLHARVYLKESPWNAVHSDLRMDCSEHADSSIAEFWIRHWASVNGGAEFELETTKLTKEQFQKRTSFELTAKGSLTAGGTYANADEKTAPFAWLARVVPQLRPGANSVKFASRVFCYGMSHVGHTVAAGELTVNATAKSLDELTARGHSKLTESVHSKADLAKIREKITKHYAAEWDLLEFRTAGEWQPHRNDLGIVLARRAPSVALMKKKDGRECVLVSIMLEEPFDGRTYGPALNFAFASPRPFVCGWK